MARNWSVQQLNELGRVRLSRSFFMRDMLHSEIAQAHGLINAPEDPELAVAAGTLRQAFRVKSRRRWRSDGICWFHAEAREMIAHAFVLAALLEEIGVPVRKAATHRPGTILYRNPFQIVAKPIEATPTLYH